MIMYFSATGNTRFVAEQLAKQLCDETLDLFSRIRNEDYSEIHSEKPFVICSPIYVSELPPFYAEYLKRITLTGSRIAYAAFSNGGYSGIAGAQMKSILRKKGMDFKGYAEFKFPGNHITNKTHREISDEEIKARIRSSYEKIDSSAEVIRKSDSFSNRHIWLLEKIVTVPVAPVLRHMVQTTKDFWVTEGCISCGKCEKICPAAIIQMKDGRPAWNAKRCEHCMACIQNCPVEAIEYGKNTQNKKRYNLKKYKDF